MLEYKYSQSKKPERVNMLIRGIILRSAKRWFKPPSMKSAPNLRMDFVKSKGACRLDPTPKRALADTTSELLLDILQFVFLFQIIAQSLPPLLVQGVDHYIHAHCSKLSFPRSDVLRFHDLADSIEEVKML